MTIPTIAEQIKYADLQMAAEAFLRDEITGELVPSRDRFILALTNGNNHSSRFTQTQAEAFVDNWQVVDQRANTDTGFSGTLFKNRDTGEYVISFRSTEFIDDAIRDNGSNTYEIKNTGFAWGQIRDMEDWYKELTRAGGALENPGQHFSVTGYSLGGHLATVFNILRSEDGTHERISETVTFNSAGVGLMETGEREVPALNLGAIPFMKVAS